MGSHVATYRGHFKTQNLLLNFFLRCDLQYLMNEYNYESTSGCIIVMPYYKYHFFTIYFILKNLVSLSFK